MATRIGAVTLSPITPKEKKKIKLKSDYQ